MALNIKHKKWVIGLTFFFKSTKKNKLHGPPIKYPNIFELP